MDYQKITLSIAGNDKTLRKFLQMIGYMDHCGNIGHSTGFQVGFDGDGAARIKVEFDDKEDQKAYDDMKRTFDENTINTIEKTGFSFE